MHENEQPLEFLLYDDGTCGPVESERWRTEALPHLRGWMESGEVTLLDRDTREALDVAVDDVTPEFLMSQRVIFHATGEVAKGMREGGIFLEEGETPDDMWRVAMRDLIDDAPAAAYVPRRDTPAVGDKPPCTPKEMPDLRLALLSGWKRPGWQVGARSGVMRAREMHTVHENYPMTLATAVKHYIGYEERTLREAELWWVGPEMCDLLYLTATKIPLDARQEHFALPSPAGLVVFAKPWAGGTDAVTPAHPVIVDAITWGHANIGHTEGNGDRHALSVSHYRLLRFDLGLAPTELQLATNLGAFDHAHKTITQREPGRVVYDVTGEEWAPLGRSDWPVSDAIGEVDPYIDPNLPVDDPLRATYLASLTEDRRLIAALAMLLNTRTIATLEAEALPRQTRRRSQRAGVPADVKVVVLRRPDRHHEQEEPQEGADDKPAPEWSHRWIVSAHPRLQPYGPGRTLRRLIMVPPHVKGPEDKPLVLKETVKAWVK